MSTNPYLEIAKADAKRYDRLKDLPYILNLWPDQLSNFTEKGTRLIIHMLEKKNQRLTCERDPLYSISEHQGVLSALVAERDRLSHILLTSANKRN